MYNESFNSSTISSKKNAKTIEDYEFINKPKKETGELGKGAFGEVKLAKEIKTGKIVAIK